MSMPGSTIASIQAGHMIDPTQMRRIEKRYEEILLETNPSQLAGRIGTIYAQALLNVAVQRGEAEEISNELDSLVHQVFEADPALEEFFANPAVNRKHKMAAIDKAFAGKCSPLVEDFLRLLCKHDRMAHLRIIAISYQALRDKLNKRIRVLVESAVPLESEQLDRLKKMLADRLAMEPILINRVRPELLGGILLHVGDKVFDTTVRSRLDTLRSQFLARGSHEIQTGRDRFSSNV